MKYLYDLCGEKMNDLIANVGKGKRGSRDLAFDSEGRGFIGKVTTNYDTSIAL